MSVWKTKQEKLSEWIPADPAWQSTKKAFENLQIIKSNHPEGIPLDVLSDWFDEYTKAGYRNLVYSLWFVNDDLVPTWLGGNAEIPHLKSQDKIVNGSTKNQVLVPLTEVVEEKADWMNLL
jgi:hypothetical protein